MVSRPMKKKMVDFPSIYVALREIIPRDFFCGKKDMDLTRINTSS